MGSATALASPIPTRKFRRESCSSFESTPRNRSPSMTGRPKYRCEINSTEAKMVPVLQPASEFRAHAFQAAVAKARELGWIV
jgi:hypothetical protein